MSDFCGVPAYAIEVLSVCFQAPRIEAVSVESVFLRFLVGARNIVGDSVVDNAVRPLV